MKSPSIYDANVLLHPDHEKLSVCQSKETLALDHESRAKMLENPGLVPPVDYKALNKLYDTFVSQKEPTNEQVYWKPPNEVTKPVTPFVHTRPKRCQIFSRINDMKKLITHIECELGLRLNPNEKPYRLRDCC